MEAEYWLALQICDSGFPGGSLPHSGGLGKLILLAMIVAIKS